MTEQEKLDFVNAGKAARDKEIVDMFKAMRSKDNTHTDYSIANVLTISEVIKAIEEMA